MHRKPIDCGLNINGLALLVEAALGLYPFAPAVYVFSNRRRNRVKILGRDRRRPRPALAGPLPASARRAARPDVRRRRWRPFAQRPTAIFRSRPTATARWVCARHCAGSLSRLAPPDTSSGSTLEHRNWSSSSARAISAKRTSTEGGSGSASGGNRGLPGSRRSLTALPGRPREAANHGSRHGPEPTGSRVRTPQGRGWHRAPAHRLGATRPGIRTT